MGKIKKINLIIIIIFIMINIIAVNKCYGTTHSVGGKSIEAKTTTTTINPDDYKPGNITTEDTHFVYKKANIIIGAVRNISAVVSVIVLIGIGIKYMIGSAEEKANYKETMMPYIIGCIMVTAGSSLVSIIYRIFD